MKAWSLNPESAHVDSVSLYEKIALQIFYEERNAFSMFVRPQEYTTYILLSTGTWFTGKLYKASPGIVKLNFKYEWTQVFKYDKEITQKYMSLE